MSNIRGLSDLGGGDDSKKPSTNEYYAGGVGQQGSGSGVAVLGGDGGPSPVDRVIGAAREHTTGQQRDMASSSKPAFAITFWKDGFQVGDGPQENRQFLDQVGRGVVPRELRDQAGGSDVDVSVVDKRAEAFAEQPKPARVAFSGEGQRLSSGPGPAASGAAVAGSAAGDVSVSFKEGEPRKAVQVRTHDGRRLRQEFNPSHTVGDLQRFVQGAAPSERPFILVAGFPPKPLADASATLQDAQVLGSAVTQRLQ